MDGDRDRPESGKGETPPPSSPEDSRKKERKENRAAKKLGTKRGYETMFRAAYRTHMDLTNLADTKANILISLNGIIISVLIASISPKIDSNPWLLLPTAAILLTCLGSLTFSIRAARPRVTKNKVTLDDVWNDRENLLFFGNFVGLEREEFVAGLEKIMEDKARPYRNMMRDLYGLGKVLDQKFELLRTAYNIFLYGITVGILLFLVTFVLVAGSWIDVTGGAGI